MISFMSFGVQQWQELSDTFWREQVSISPTSCSYGHEHLIVMQSTHPKPSLYFCHMAFE